MSAGQKPLVVWGAAGHALVIAEFAPALGYEIVALFDNDDRVRSPLAGVPLHHGRAGFERWRSASPGAMDFAVAIGGGRGVDRLALSAMLEASGLRPATLVHPSAFVATSARIGPGSQILAQASVCAHAAIGRACIVNTGAIVEHESEVSDGAHVGPGAVLCGCVRLGACAFVGAGAVVMPRRSIASGATVAAGAVVTADVAADSTVAGIPARPFGLTKERGA